MRNSWEYPSQMPEGTTPGAPNRRPGGRRTNITTIREKPFGAGGRGAVASDGIKGTRHSCGPLPRRLHGDAPALRPSHESPRRWAPSPIKGPCSRGDEASQSGAWGSVERGGAQGTAHWDGRIAPQLLPGESMLRQEIVLTRATEEMAAAASIERGQVRLQPTRSTPDGSQGHGRFPSRGGWSERRSIVMAATSSLHT